MTDNKSIQAEKGAVAVDLAYKSLIQTINQYHYHPGLSEDDAIQREHQYLRRISNDCGSLEWLSQMELEDGHSPVLQLDAVYTPQRVVEREHFEHVEELQPKHSGREPRQLSAVELLNREQRLVLSGAAGSGKSALINYLLLCMAGEVLGKPTLNLNALTEPMPDEDGDAQQQAQRWDHGFLIPLRVILRDFATSEQFPTTDEQGDACHMLNFIEAELKHWCCEDYFPVLRGRLTQGKVLLLFDGLDEVPLAHQRREKLIACIHGMVNSYSDAQCTCRVLVTCRPYAYQQQHWQLARFADGTLAEFHNGQIRWFVERWYQQPLGLKQEQAEQRRDKFINSVLQRDSLRDLVKRPLLLSLCAYLHARQHELPERRAELYLLRSRLPHF
ncbi:MAG: hypothetical protein K0U68_04130 [Gammaproteobacteria bacterium]|nr:hypothetical protein [Gammaproteobacteria bacterium]